MGSEELREAWPLPSYKIDKEMKTYEEIKKEEFEYTKEFSDKRLRRYLRLCRMLSRIMNIKVLWAISVIPMVAVALLFHLFGGIFSFGVIDALLLTIAHFFYWKIKGEKDSRKLLDEVGPELEMTLIAIEEIIDERNNG